ncbi:hypothetical protein EPH95_17875 [Salicibibacter halophilus]|uniref:Cell wall-active antibiotics response LiaF-like C-terminal domain-containing protein n=1 Tax=Salicibibacter halophilus TaxID=2502791 RepID=A0A514LLU4_9BACI|nr:LiaF domain-containing protein [Salicibibacter halophilus]QDI92806.1 hypothetical protein EPH95_17875 [Salicibibacter halophilus]
MERSRISMLFMLVLASGLIFNFFMSGISMFGFILPLLFALIALFCALNTHKSGSYFFMALSAGLMAGYWTNIGTWIFLVTIPVLFLIIAMLKKTGKEIDVDKDLRGSQAPKPEPQQAQLIVPKSKWVVLGDYKLKKQAFSMQDELELNVVLGSASIDMTRAMIETESMDIAVMDVLGETKIKLPEEWSATVEIVSALGSVRVLGHKEEGAFDRTTLQYGEPEHSFGHLNVKVTTILGDVKISQKKQK